MTSKLFSKDTTLMHVTCTTLFVAFTFCYLYFYQCDLIAASQHILSGGQTHYDRLIGGCIVTLALFCVHLAFLAVIRLMYRAYALTFYPSLLILLIMTVVQIPDSAHCNYGVWVCARSLALRGCDSHCLPCQEIRVDRKGEEAGRLLFEDFLE